MLFRAPWRMLISTRCTLVVFVACSQDVPRPAQLFGDSFELADSLAVQMSDGRILVCGDVECSSELRPIRNARSVARTAHGFCAVTLEGWLLCTSATTLLNATSWIREYDVTARYTSVSSMCATTSAGASLCWDPALDAPEHVGQALCGYFLLQDNRLYDPTSQRTVLDYVTGVSCNQALDPSHETTCAVTWAGQLFCWGANTGGRLGDGTSASRVLPTWIANGFSSVAVGPDGADTSCGVHIDGSVWCWGRGSGSPDFKPIAMVDIPRASHIARVSYDFYVITYDGQLERFTPPDTTPHFISVR